MDYIAVIHKDPDSGFGVSFPDFLGCVTVGDTLEEARVLAKEALEFHIDGMKADGDPIPEPSNIDTVIANPDFADGVLFVVTADNAPEKAVRINISVPENALRLIDKAAEKFHISRSALMVQSTLRQVGVAAH